jgi:hypothetical protein
MDGTTIVTASQTKKALDYFRKLCMGQNQVLPDLVAQFEKDIKGNKKVSAFAKALQTSILEVKGVQEDLGLDSLASRGAVNLISKNMNKEDTMELISYLVIKE